jgi:hypothetical protein
MLYQGVRPVFPTAIANLGAQRFAPRSVVRRVCRPPAVPTTKALIDVLPVALHRQTQHDQDNHALAGRAVSGIAVYKHGGTRPRVDRVWHPADSPKDYHALPRGQAWQARPVVGKGCCPRDSAWSGCAQSTGCPPAPAWKIVGQQQGKAHNF